jgi:hypothetical protein
MGCRCFVASIQCSEYWPPPTKKWFIFRLLLSLFGSPYEIAEPLFVMHRTYCIAFSVRIPHSNQRTLAAALGWPTLAR